MPREEPELTLKRITASAPWQFYALVRLESTLLELFEALSDISKHSPQLAQLVVDAGAVTLLTKARPSNLQTGPHIYGRYW